MTFNEYEMLCNSLKVQIQGLKNTEKEAQEKYVESNRKYANGTIVKAKSVNNYYVGKIISAFFNVFSPNKIAYRIDANGLPIASNERDIEVIDAKSEFIELMGKIADEMEKIIKKKEKLIADYAETQRKYPNGTSVLGSLEIGGATSDGQGNIMYRLFYSSLDRSGASLIMPEEEVELRLGKKKNTVEFERKNVGD